MVGEKVVLENNLVKWFSKLKAKDVNLAGEKGANLGELKKLKIPMPEGFVITTKAYDLFLNEANIHEQINSLLTQANVNNKNQLEEVISKIKEMILKAEFPDELYEEIIESYEYLGADKSEIAKGSALDILNNAAEPIFVAVRSSLPLKDIEKTNGLREQDTYLNVKGAEELFNHIKKCFASLFNINTVKRFLESKEKVDKFKIAVIVQKMVEGDKSGVVYSRDSSDNIVIRSIWGLGEGMNLNDIHPDKYILSRELEVLDGKINEKNFGVVRDAGGNLKKVKLSPERSSCSSLSNSEIQRLGDLAEKVEENFKHPQEIEFVISEDIYLVQTKNFGLEKTKVIEEKEKIVSEEVIVEDKVKTTIERVEKVTKTKLNLVVDSPFFIDDYKETGLKKVGFLKLENIIKEFGKHPNYFLNSNYINEYENLIYSGVKKFVDNFDETWVRTSDFFSDDFADLTGSPKAEKNPFLGLHGIRYGLKNVEILEAELRAFKKASVHGKKFGILIPGITSIEELRKVRDLMIEINFEPMIGIIVETPASVQLIKDFIDAGINRILIQTDNLIQHLLGIDIKNEFVKDLYDEMHPALMYQLEYVIRVCKRRGIDTSIVGKALENSDLLKYLLQKEISIVCVEPENAKVFSENISNFEEEIFSDTDKEPRQYELNKEKEKYLEEAPKTMEDLEVLHETEKVSIPISEKTMEEIEAIREEKREYLEEHPEEVNFENEENLEIEDETGVPDEIREHSNEEFDEEIESHEDIIEDIDEAISLIEEEKKEVLKSDLNDEIREHPDEEFDSIIEDEDDSSEDEYSKDPLGIL